jgi:SOS response associated peptidase (SRAP)
MTGCAYFSRRDGEPLTFAGLWDEWKDRSTGETLKSCTVIITEPNDFVADIHNRMPVILGDRNFPEWLNDGGTKLLKPAADELLQRWPVSRRVNSSKADPDDETLIERNSLGPPLFAKFKPVQNVKIQSAVYCDEEATGFRRSLAGARRQPADVQHRSCASGTRCIKQASS